MNEAPTQRHRAATFSIGFITLALVISAFLSGTASAKIVELTGYSGLSFNGSDAVGAPAPFSGGLHDMGIDQETGEVYAGNANSSRVYKFNAAGESVAFSGLAGNTAFEQSLNNFGDVFVDNSGTATQGRIYSFRESGTIAAHEPDGLTATNFPAGASAACGGDVAPDGTYWIASWSGSKVSQYNQVTGAATGATFTTQSPCDLAIDSQGNFYAVQESNGTVRKYDPTGALIGVFDSTGNPEPELAIDLSNDHVYVDHRSYVLEFEPSGALLNRFGEAEGGYPGLQNSRGLTVSAGDHSVYAMNERGGEPRVDVFAPTGAITIPDAITNVPDVEPSTAVLRGVVNGDGVDTTDCEFEWGPTSLSSYNHVEECSEGKVFAGGSGDHDVSVAIAGLTKGTSYHFRVTAKNSNNVVSTGADRIFTASGKPLVVSSGVSKINTDGAQFNLTLDPNGGVTKYHVEWGLEAGVYGNMFPEPDGELESTLSPESFSRFLSGLSPDTEYHYRVVASNDAGATEGQDRTFRTFPPPPPNDPCPNALVRKQTGAALLADCRAYELVSASDQGGYDVESDLIGNQIPLTAQPRAKDRALYSLHYGALPDAQDPTNFGHDPYLATRGATGWTSSYVGLPAASLPSLEPYGSPLMAADPGLDSFAFGGSGICAPCFADGSTNIPLRLPGGSLVKGMSGPGNPGPANPAGRVDQQFSGDGNHFVFGADKAFAPGGNASSVSIYDRNLATGATQVVSTMPNGATMTGAGIAELDISSDGSRIVVGQRVETDAEGNDYFHLYMHIGNNKGTYDLTPGTTTGALFNGMTADGSKVFFSTKDPILTSSNQDTDTSADLFRTNVAPNAAVTVERVSTGSGGTGNTDACEPITEWNVASGGPDCGTLAFAGGAGVARGDGTVYFLSPEKLDGSANGVEDQPNLYVVEPEGAPHFVATMDSSLTKPGPKGPEHPVVDSSFAQTFENPSGMSVDQDTGDVYIPELNSGKVYRFNADGTPDDFTAGPDAGTNTLTGFSWAFGPSTAQVAVDNSSGPAGGNIYVVDGPEPFSSSVKVYSSTGALLTSLAGTGTESPYGAFGLACGVAVDTSNGDLYVGDYVGFVWRYTPGAATPEEADYSGAIEGEMFDGTCNVGVAAGNVYAAHVEGEKALSAFSTGDFGLGAPPKPAGSLLATGVTGVATDPVIGDVYAGQAGKVTVFDSSGTQIGQLGSGALSSSVGVAINSETHHVYATSGGANVVELGYVIPPYEPIDNPAIVHAVTQASTHSYGDFQVTPDGSFAAFNSSQSLNGASNKGRYAIFWYDAGGGDVECVSCGPSSTAGAILTPTGLNLSDDGRVFFTTSEQFVLRDTNEKKDAYEWNEGLAQIISSGTSPADSGIVSVSGDGVNAFFFTRDTLAPQDENGSPMKIYTAREGGGFLYTAPPFPCAASDECHGPGTQAAPPPDIDTVEGSGRSPATRSHPKRCKRGFVKKHGKCKKKRKRKHRKRRHHRKTKTHRHG